MDGRVLGVVLPLPAASPAALRFGPSEALAPVCGA